MAFGIMFHHFHGRSHSKTQGSISAKQLCKIIYFLKKKFKIVPKSMSHPYGRYNNSSIRVLKKIGIKLGFLSSFTKGKIFSSLEVPRYDHIYMINKFSKNKL